MIINPRLILINFMKNILFIFLLLLNFTMNAEVSKISYRGWDGCYKISNKNTVVIVSPQSGGRVFSYSNNGEDIIYQNESQNGKSYQEWKSEPFDPDAGRFDIGPEKETESRHDSTFMGEWQVVKITSYSLTILSIKNKSLSTEWERTFILDPKTSKLLIKNSIQNISSRQIKLHYWSRTLVKPEGWLLLPTSSKSIYSKGWGMFYTRSDKNDFVDNRFSRNADTVYLHAVDGYVIKGGTDSKKGYMEYNRGNIQFIKRFKVYSRGDYSATLNMTTIFYLCPKFLEMEPVSPLVTLKPLQKLHFDETWFLKVKEN